MLAIGAIVVASSVWRSERLPRWSGVPLAIGIALYIPQFSGPQWIRVAHGALMLVGCWWLAWSIATPARRGTE